MILFQATGQFFPCTTQILGPDTIEITLAAPPGEQFDASKSYYFWVEICVP